MNYNDFLNVFIHIKVITCMFVNVFWGKVKDEFIMSINYV